MTAEYERHLSPLRDALRIHASVEDARIEQTGGEVYCVVGTLPNGWEIAADGHGFTFTDANGHSMLVANHYENGDALTVDLYPDEDASAPYAGRIDEDEAAAAAVVALFLYRETVQSWG